MKNDQINIAMVDDHQIVIDGLKSLLLGHPRLTVVLETTDPTTLLEKIAGKQIHVLVTDVMMPGLNGAELAKLVRKQYPDIRILALSMSGQGELVNQMIDDSDIAGYVLKNIGKQEFIAALEKIAAGGLYFTDEVMQEMTKASERKTELDHAHLTLREIEIIRLIEKEYNNKKIADTLFLSERTVETHRKNIFRKTRTSSVLGLIKYAYEHHLIEVK
ncbi:MAG TPA: response regulator transcription factor [Ferruginibacter sp.]|nr:response regulator transcription factor [Ferruginibacter sp.]